MGFNPMKILRKKAQPNSPEHSAVKDRLSRISRQNRTETAVASLLESDVSLSSPVAQHSGSNEVADQVKNGHIGHHGTVLDENLAEAPRSTTGTQVQRTVERAGQGANGGLAEIGVTEFGVTESRQAMQPGAPLAAAAATSVSRAPQASMNHAPDDHSSRQPSGHAEAGHPDQQHRQPGEPEAVASNASESSDAKSYKSSLAPIDIEVPERIGNYVLGEKLGSGTCGVVHRAFDSVLQREVAVKLSPVGEVSGSTGKVPGAQRAYQTEVYAAGRLHHPNIVTVFDAGQYADLNYLVMEVIDGDSLKKYGKGQKLLPTWRALQIICDSCKALDYSHRQGILHRDIKPANIMISSNDTVKLLDFGIAVGLTEDGGLSRRGPTLGTPNYMSPEQILGKDLTPSSDFYSLGTVLFEMLTGKQLFKADKVKELFRTVVHKPAPKLSEFRPDLPQALSDILEKVLQKKPALRYQSGIEMIDALQGFVDQFRIIEELPERQRAMLDRLSALTFFDSFKLVDIALLVAESELKTVKAGVQLLPDGNIERELIILVDGVVRVDESTDKLVSVHGAGECIGEAGFIHGNRQPLTFTVLEESHVLVVTDSALSSLPPLLHLEYYKRCADILLTRLEHDVPESGVDIAL